MSFRPDRKHEREVTQRSAHRHEERSPKAERHAGEDRPHHHPVRAGIQKLRRSIDEREARAVLRDFVRGADHAAA